MKEYIFGMSVPRILIFRLMVDFLVILSLFKIKNTETKIKKTIPLILFAIILLFSLISSSISISPTLSLFSNFERMDGTIDQIHFFVFFIIISNTNLSKKYWFYIALFSTFIAVIVSIFGIYQSLTIPYYRAESTLSNPLYLAIYLIIHFYIVLMIIFHLIKSELIFNKKVLFIILSISILLLFGFALISTWSRSVLTSLGISFVFLFCGVVYINRRNNTINNTKLVLVSLVFITIISVIGFFYLDAYASINRITDFSFKEESTNSRFQLWEMAIENWQEKPILGWGKESFQYFYSKYYNPKMYNIGFWYDRSHNEFLDNLIEGGLIGFLCNLLGIIAIFGLILDKNQSISKYEKLIVACLFIAYYIFLFTCFDSFISNILIFTILGYLSQNFKTEKYFKLKKQSLLISITLIVCSIYISYEVTLKTIITYKEWNKASRSQTIEEFTELYNNAFEESSYIGKYDISIDFALKRDRINTSQLDERTKKVYYDLSEKMLLKSLEIYPNHPIILSQLGFIQDEGGKTNKAIETYLELKKIAPLRQINLMDLGVFYLKNKEFQKADSLFNYVYNLNKNYEKAILYKAYGLSLNKAKSETLLTLKKLPNKYLFENIEMLIRIYSNLDNIEGLMKYISVSNKGDFKPDTYLIWLKIATELGNKDEIHKSLIGFILHILPNALKQEEIENLNSLEQDIYLMKKPPEIIQNIYQKYWWD